MKQTLNEKITDHLDILQREISYRADVLVRRCRLRFPPGYERRLCLFRHRSYSVP